MQIIVTPGKITYITNTGDWRLVIGDGVFAIQPQVGEWEYLSGVNLDNLATLIIDAKADAVERGIQWSGN